MRARAGGPVEHGGMPARSLCMKKKVPVAELKPGMWVAELDRPWRETPFLFQGFEIRSPEEIEELKRYCRHVFVIEPEAYPGTGTARTPAPAAPRLLTTPTAYDEYELLRRTTAPRFDATYADASTLEEEVAAIAPPHAEARALIREVMEDVRLGKNLDALRARRVVAELVESVIRNPDALTCFIQLKKKDEYTALHSLRVCILALAFGRHLGLPREELNVLGVGALLHDIGKMKVPNEILNKPGELTEYEFALMKAHVPRGVEILERTVGIPAAAVQVARCHHERYDGQGYVGGLSGDRIGLFGMVGGIVDCYDAISSDRAYHAGMSSHAALKQMYEWRGAAFHPGLVEQFIQCMGIYPIGSVVALNTAEIGVVVTMNRVRRLKPRVALVLKSDGTPYGRSAIVDLMAHTTRDGRPCEIERVLEPGAYGINPTTYLPLPRLPEAAGGGAIKW
jgi:putative nucleotidyltransferase with HDIG domain